MEHTTHIRYSAVSLFAALLLAALLLLGGTAAANAIKKSSFYQQSRLLQLIVAQDGISLAGLMEDGQSVDTALKFARAVTDAYVTFEFIPMHEAKTFVQIFESLSEDIEISQFRYHGRDLTITGTAPSLQSYVDFISRLEGRGYFSQVIGTNYINQQDRVRFEILCLTKNETASAYSSFLPPLGE
ncbi:hypothetical protein U6B65_09245 [Oscillospiraceae bacterium MB08-C2-2]|nr:hypothetical protein U6B65_09245 [Oscillospiraceae bacterium MB08-C2-2]